jgi:hydrogenase expression/formation protein HypE
MHAGKSGGPLYGIFRGQLRRLSEIWRINSMSNESHMPSIKLEHGSGGALSRDLIDRLIFPIFKNKHFPRLSDATAFLLTEESLITTDSYIIDPPFFPGGDIGRLAVFGTCNDLAVSGGKPQYITLALILEEGFALASLEKILKSALEAAKEAGVQVLTGDTKVVPRGKGGNIFINTTGVGRRVFPFQLTPQSIKRGDLVIVTGPLGSHGIAVLAAREELKVAKHLKTDCAFLYPLCSDFFTFGSQLRFLRDATRGGAAAILNEICQHQDFGIEVREEAFPVEDEVALAADILGLNPLEIANEGVAVAVVASSVAEEACRKLKNQPLGRRAAIVGEITGNNEGRAILKTRAGGRRILDYPRGLLLPRIC